MFDLLFVIGESALLYFSYYLYLGDESFDDCGIVMTDVIMSDECANIISQPRSLLLGKVSSEFDDTNESGTNVPSGLTSDGNTCFLASATQVLITIPSIKRPVVVWVSKLGENKLYVIIL